MSIRNVYLTRSRDHLIDMLGLASPNDPMSTTPSSSLQKPAKNSPSVCFNCLIMSYLVHKVPIVTQL